MSPLPYDSTEALLCEVVRAAHRALEEVQSRVWARLRRRRIPGPLPSRTLRTALRHPERDERAGGGRAKWDTPSQSWLVAKVSQARRVPFRIPVVNHRIRDSADPCVQRSGSTRPEVLRLSLIHI